MYLKSITLKGFKSFAQPTTLNLEPGITCVVGPNGSGKSNVVDALAWVMGEQGPKTLRGGKMEDVIFAGTATKGPLGRAEVQLTIDNSDGALPIEYAEVTISRVLFRNGASEYAINGESCRLLDVQELLSDSGLGREMHVIVGQGQLDTVLRATPIERRAFIEEAAGILKYRRRKEKTERKLEAMQVNLTRLNDLTAELRRNLKPLGRQAEVARQAKEIGAIARLAKSRLLKFQIVAIREQLEKAAKSENERKADSSVVQDQLNSARAGIQELESQLVSTELDALRQKLFAFESLESKLRSLQNLAQQKISFLGQQEFSSREIEVADLSAQLASAVQDLESLEGEIETSANDLRELEASRLAAVAALADFESAELKQRAEVESKALERSKLENQISVLQSKAEGFDSQAEALKLVIASLSEQIAKLTAEQLALTPESESLSDEGLRVEYERSQENQSKARATLDAAKDALHAAERERDAIAAKHAALGLTLEQNDGSIEVRNAGLTGIKGLLAESVSIQSGYEVAIAVALGTIADAVVAGSRSQALAAIKFLKGEGLGRAEFLVVDGPVIRAEKVTKSGLTLASSVVSAPKQVLDVLEGIFIAEDLSAAEAALEGGFEGKAIITLDGDWVSRSLIRGGGTKQPSKLELAAERESASRRLSELAEEITELAQELEASRQALDASEQASRESLSKLQQYDAELAAKAERVGRLIAQLESAKEDKTRQESELDRLAEASQAARLEIADLERALEALPQVSVLTSNPDARAGLVEALEKARQAELEVRIQVGAVSERRSAASKNVAVLKGRLAEATAAQERDRQATEAKLSQLRRAESALQAIPAALEVATESATQIRSEVRELEAQRIQRTQRLSTLRSQAAELEVKLAELNKSVHEVEMRNHELRLNLANLTERVASELYVDVEVMLSETELGDENREQLEKDLRVAEQKLSQLGAFNPLALEEFAALEERHKYLAEQLEDLSKARTDLIGIIKDLDLKMQGIFASAFEDTRREFEKVFPILFPGGAGSISLTEPEDLLATGIEVSVRPVGKRIERMSLLSGGERSLAAVALLIAIFKARPSPFYVLDEVEAALDDANLGRLLEVIESLRKSSQLIVVTHQKRTMEIADALYGVSMRQDGMSAVVGQKLERANA
ncbi:chromosome segregation protein SMC [Aquiluna borgnonia]|uniref:Chromosome partition protein Smc n=1 Tax=Aquiluna borgnonia TaxID=2499157 RepID=A0A7D4U7G8_9MICO|nr:chromosome segregation protein SMC [Aquiluna borgnonia]QKJ25056.1 chromosome segregation protein SMC [Aquiluna borgnonia]